MGYVYILINQSYRYGGLRRKLLKIGQTSRNPEERAKELSSTGVPTPFEVAYYIQSDKYEKIGGFSVNNDEIEVPPNPLISSAFNSCSV